MKTGDAEARAFAKTEAMGQESISRLLFRFSMPAIIQMEASAGYNLFDAIWVGRLGAEALAALTVAAPLMAIYTAIGVGIEHGAESLIARILGAGKKEEANRAAGCSISLFFIVGGLVTIICLLNLETLLRLFGADDAVLPLAMSYMFVETCSIAVNFFLFVLVALVRVQGSPTLASASAITASIMDIIWSPILVFGVGPFPALGVAGAALGTTIGRGIGASILLIYLGLGKSIYKFKPSHFLPNLRIVTDIYRIGIAGTMQLGATSMSQIIACRVATTFGVIPLAVLGVLYKVTSVIIGVSSGVSHGMLPLVGYNFGAQERERVGELVVKAGLVSIMWGALCWVAVMSFSTQIMSLFGADPNFLAGGMPALNIFAFCFFFMGFQSNLSAFFQGIGKAIPSLVVSSCNFIFLIPCLLIMPDVFGLSGLWAAYPVAYTLSALFSLTWAGLAFRSLKIPLRW